MQVNRVNTINYNSRVSFRESEGESWCESRIIYNSADYEHKKIQINIEYDSKREWLLKNNPHHQNSEWYIDAVRNIENLRAKALEELEQAWRKFRPKK